MNDGMTPEAYESWRRECLAEYRGRFGDDMPIGSLHLNATELHSFTEECCDRALTEAAGFDYDEPDDFPWRNTYFDPYDASFEWELRDPDWRPTTETMGRWRALGFARCWLWTKATHHAPGEVYIDLSTKEVSVRTAPRVPLRPSGDGFSCSKCGAFLAALDTPARNVRYMVCPRCDNCPAEAEERRLRSELRTARALAVAAWCVAAASVLLWTLQ